MTREEKIAILQKIAAGEVSPEALKPKHMVYKIFVPQTASNVNGLYVNGKLSTDPEDIKAYERNNKGPEKIIVTRT